MLNVTKNNGNLWSLFLPWIFLTKSGSTWNHQPWSFRRLSSTLLWYGKQSHNQNALLRSPWPYETADPHATSHVSALTFCFLTVVGSPGDAYVTHSSASVFVDATCWCLLSFPITLAKKNKWKKNHKIWKMIHLICELSRELYQRVAQNESLTFLMATSHCETEGLVLNEWHRNIYFFHLQNVHP